MEDRAGPTRAGLENEKPVKKSNRGTVLEAATFCMRSLLSIVLVASNVSLSADVTLALMRIASFSDKTELKAVENSSDAILFSPS